MPLMIPGASGEAVAFGGPALPDPYVAMAAELCEMGAGPCGCDPVGKPRVCSHPDRPAEVYRPTCLACKSREEWETRVDGTT